VTERRSDDNLVNLVKKRAEQKGKENDMPSPSFKRPQQEYSAPQPPDQVSASQPKGSTNGFRRPKLKPKERKDLPRVTFYIEAEQKRYLDYWSAIDARGISEIVRDALDQWFEMRELQALDEEES
jgi:hypothetical protein